MKGNDMDSIPLKGLPSKRTLAKMAKANALRPKDDALRALLLLEKQRRQAFYVADNAAGERVPPDPSLKDVGLIERSRAASHTRRVLLKGGGTYTPEAWLAACDRADNRCLRCGSDEPLTVDHVIPINYGGPNTIENLQPLCRRCNSIKGTNSTDYRK